jgi:regulator of RNase E activity RraA
MGFRAPFTLIERNAMSKNVTTPQTIRREIERVSAEVARRAATFPASVLSDVAGRRGSMNGRISALSPSMKVAGPAVTVEVRPGDNLMIHAAMAIAQPGDVIVIDGKGDQTCALVGEIVVTQCLAVGIAGIVVDAAVRDIEPIRSMGFPVFSVGSNPNGPTKLVPGRINWPVSVGGITVNPGDLIVGDADGVVVIERDKAESVLDLATKKITDETRRIEEIRNGQLKPSWLDSALQVAGMLNKGETL